MRERLPQLLGLALLAVALAVGLFALASGIRARDARDTISVTGSAKRAIRSNYVVWNASVSSQRPTPAAASQELARWTERIRDFLRDAGARDDEVQIAPVATETISGTSPDGSETGAVVAYRLTRTFEVRSSRVQEMTGLVEKSSTLLAQGVPIAAQSPQYVFTKLPDLRPELLADATRDALRRARVLVSSTGGDLGDLRDVDVGVFQITPRNSTDVSDSGVYDTSTIEKDVTAVVNVTFALD